MRDHHTGWSECPHCGVIHDAAANITNERPPEEGDPSICLACGGLATFTDAHGGRRMPTPAEYDQFLANPEVARGIAAWAIADARGWH